MVIDDTLKRFITPRMKVYLTRNHTRKGGPIYHKTLDDDAELNENNFVMSDSKECLRYTEEVGDRLTREFPAVFDKQTGFCDHTGVPGDFNSVRCVSQWGQDPLPMPLVDNENLLKAEGLATAMDQADHLWFTKLVQLFYGSAVPEPIRIRKEGTTAAPDFEKEDIVYKKLYTMKIVKNFSTVARLVTMKKGLDLLKEFRIIFMSVIMSRLQPDKVYQENGEWKTKARLAPTPEEARGGLAAKNYADKRVRDKQGNVIEGHFAMRMRDVFAFNGVMNYAMSGIMGCFRAVYLMRYAVTFKTRGAQDKEDRIQPFKFIVGSDVKTMDKLIPRWFIDAFHDELTKYLDEGIVEVMRAMFKAPYLYSPNGTYGKDFNPLVGGDPLKLDANNHPGLPSGIAQNPDIGKIWMVFNYMLATRDCGGLNTPSDIDPWLSGANADFGLQDMADDATFMTNVEASAKAFIAYKSRYCVFEQEIPVIFLGDVYAMDAGKKIVLPNPVSYPVNEIAREDSVANKPVSQIAFGREAREVVYSRSPIYRDMKAIMREAQVKHLGFDVAALYRRVSMPVSQYNPVDLQFVMNKAVINYKVDPADVTPILLDTYVATIPANEFWDDIRGYFKFATSPYAAADAERIALKELSKVH